MDNLKYALFLIFSFFINLSGCSNRYSASGYIEGEYTYIASGVSGTLTQLAVTRGQSIQPGQLLYQLDLEPELSGLENTQQTIQEIKAQLLYAQQTLNRTRQLHAKHFASIAELDQAQAAFDSKTAALSAHQALYKQAQWSLQQKTMRAKNSALVFDTFFRVGEKVPAHQPVLALLLPENIKVLFFLPENKLHEMKLGQKIQFTCDQCKRNYTAKIQYISPEAEYTPPVIYSKDSRDKLVYLIRAEIPVETAVQFHPGQPVDVLW